MSHSMPSDELCATVAKSAEACFQRMVDTEALTYERGKLGVLGVKLPPHTIHDYSLSATRVVIEAIKLRRDSAIRQWGECDWPFDSVKLSPAAIWQVAPIFAALQVEQGRLARLERPAA